MEIPENSAKYTEHNVLRRSGSMELVSVVEHIEFHERGYYVVIKRPVGLAIKGHPEYRNMTVLAHPQSLDELNDMWGGLCTQLKSPYEPLQMLPAVQVEKTRLDAMDLLPF